MNQQNDSSIKAQIWALVPAAGIGRRMASQQPKQYLKIHGKTILEHSLERLSRCDYVAGIAVGIAEQDTYWAELNITDQKLLGSYVGGVERIHTVVNGLDFISAWAAEGDWVMIHDAVRPCVRPEDINRLVEQALRFNRSAILATPVVDTVKKVNSQSFIQATLNRDELMLAATPQLFPLARLEQSLKAAIDQCVLSTDESAAVELLGESPLAVRTDRTNIKITTAEDLAVAELFLDRRKEV